MAETTAPQFRHLPEGSRKARLITLRRAIEPILANNLLPHFTDHSVTHSDQLADLIDRLIDPVQRTSHRLTEVELQVLYAACYLHDIGMQYEKADQTLTYGRNPTAQPWAKLSPAEKRDYLRRWHASISGDMVRQSTNSADPVIGLQLTEGDSPSRIACLCEAHTLPAESERYKELTQPSGNIRMNLLSALLRLADILDESRRRAQLARSRTLDLDVLAQSHWWRHHYVVDVTLHFDSGQIELWFSFPPEKAAEYREIVPELQLPPIREELERHRGLMAANSLHWYVGPPRFVPDPQSDAQIMPPEVQAEMARQLRQRRSGEATQHMMLALQEFLQHRPVALQQLKDLENEAFKLTPVVQLDRALDVARQLAEAGGQRTAWTTFYGFYNRLGSSLAPETRIGYAMELAELMLSDDNVSLPAMILSEFEIVVGKPEQPTDVQMRFLKLWARCLGKVGDTRAIDAHELAESLEPDAASRLQLFAERAELLLLHGRTSEALAAKPRKP